MIDVDPQFAGKTAMVHLVTSDAGINGLLVNGHYFASYGNIYNFMDCNVTPFLKVGRKNEIIVIVGGKTTLQQARIGFYDKGANYP